MRVRVRVRVKVKVRVKAICRGILSESYERIKKKIQAISTAPGQYGINSKQFIYKMHLIKNDQYLDHNQLSLTSNL
jgi:hypothetical protein